MDKKIVTGKLVVWFLGFLFFFSAFNSTGFAQVSSSKMQLYVLPEYDMLLENWPMEKPNVLVIISGNVKNNGSEPLSELQFNVPKDAIVFQVSGNYETEQQENLQVVKVTPAASILPGAEQEIVLEYYYNPISGTNDKEFVFNFAPTFDVNVVDAVIKEPLRTSNFKTQPEASSITQDDFGFTSNRHIFHMESIKAGENIELKVNYTKGDNHPSLIPQQNQPQIPGSTEPEPNTETKSFNSFVLGFTALFIFALSVLVIFSMGKEPNERKKANKTSKHNKHKGFAQERRKLKKMLDDGYITEAGYEKMLKDLEKEGGAS